MRYQEQDADAILGLLRSKGIKARIVGGVKTKGYSKHDIDLEVYAPPGWQYNKYHHVMRRLGYECIAKAGQFMEQNLECWNSRSGRVIDIWLTE